MKVRLALFGTPAIERDGRRFVLPFERRSQLLIHLALRGSWVPRSEVAALLWPEIAAALAARNLRKTLFRLPSLPGAPPLEQEGGALRLVADTDVAAFEAALQRADAPAALALYGGELLAGFDDDANDAWTSWLVRERDRLRSAWRGAALQQLGGELAPADGIALASQLLRADPLDEAAVQAQMHWLARDGQGARAREAYREFAERLHQELGVAPSGELRALHAGLASAPRPQAPADDGGFVGRAAELRQIGELLAGGCRWLTLTGPGGIGKTRLARELLRRLAPGFADGGAFVALEDAHSGAEIVDRLAREIGVTPAGRRDPFEQVLAALGAQSGLLVLDNFEHLVSHVRLLEQVLAACPRMHLIVTSRVRLGAAAEQLYPLQGLPYPEPEDADALESFDASRLFIRAARRVAPDLAPAADAAAIIDICRRVGGMPLALELAGSWTRVLSCPAIAEALRGTELLYVSDPARPPRQASLQAVFQQSWRQLGASERDALARLAVFRGGFSAEAARQVAAPLPVLAALADRSLLGREGGRSFLHPLLQHFADERLGSGAPRAAAEATHGRYFLGWLADRREPLARAERAAMSAVAEDFDNVRGAWRWAAAHEEPALLAQAAPALMSFCDHSGRFAEGLALLREAIERGAATASPNLTAALQARAAHLEHRLDRYDTAEALARAALAEARGHDAATELQCLKVLGANAIRQGRLRAAAQWYERALRHAQRNADRVNAASALSNLGLIARLRDDLDESLALTQRAALQHRELGDAAAEAMCLNNLGIVHLHRSDLASARTVLQAARRVCEQHGLPSTRSLIEANLADLAWREGDAETTELHAGHALALAEASGQRSVVAIAHHVRMRVRLRRADIVGARAELLGALQTAIAIDRADVKAGGAYLFAELLAAQGEHDCACQVMSFALRQPSIGASDRAQALARLGQWGLAPDVEPPWPGWSLDELVHRIVADAPLAHAPLIDGLRAGP